MGFITISTRIANLQNSINRRQLELTELNNRKTQSVAFTTALGDGIISLDEFCDLHKNDRIEAMNYTYNSLEAAENMLKSGYVEDYISSYQGASSDVLESAGLLMYTDGNGSFDREKIEAKLYKDYLAQYAQVSMTPAIAELDKQLQAEIDMLNTQNELELAELQALKEQKSQAISQGTIKLA